MPVERARVRAPDFAGGTWLGNEQSWLLIRSQKSRPPIVLAKEPDLFDWLAIHLTPPDSLHVQKASSRQAPSCTSRWPRGDLSMAQRSEGVTTMLKREGIAPQRPLVALHVRKALAGEVLEKGARPNVRELEDTTHDVRAACTKKLFCQTFIGRLR